MNKPLSNKESELLYYSFKSTQEWFASIITHRLSEDESIQNLTPNGFLIAEEASRYIVPSPTLQPHERIQIYNQQYWWRLLNSLHNNFPLLTRLFGRNAFNEEIGIPYLLKYPPTHWSLSALGEHLPKWISECYHEPDKSFICDAASLDLNFLAICIAPQLAFLDLQTLMAGNPENLLSYTFYLQPYLHFFSWEYDLISFREAFLEQDIDYWVEHRFPELIKEKTYRIIVFRDLQNIIRWQEISQAKSLLLEKFRNGTTIQEACEFIESQAQDLQKEMSEKMQTWLQEWTQAGWLTLEHQPHSYQ